MAAPKGNQYAKGNKGGAPLQGLESLPNEWYKQVLDLYEKGGSDAEVKGLIYKMRGSFSNDLFDRWLLEEEEFSETIKMGRMLSAGWWYGQGRENLQNKEFNFPGWYMNMKNRFGWSDRQEINQQTTLLQSAPMSKEEIQDISKGLEEEY